MKYVIGNWKMNLTGTEGSALMKGIIAELKPTESVEVGVAPSFVGLRDVWAAIGESRVKLGAQNVHFEEKGAFTGEVSAGMLRDMGCFFVIIGHSERRELFGETDEFVNKKVHAVSESGMIPLVCVGEKLDDREAGTHFDVVERQLKEGLNGVSTDKILIAYEPVWAIGTGKTATPEQAEEMHQFVKKIVKEENKIDVAVLYGGSVKPENALELFSQENIDGGLIGGASLSAESFGKIIKAAQEVEKAE